MSKRFVAASITAAFIIGAAAASVFWFVHTNEEIGYIVAQTRPFRQANNPYKFIDPLLGYDIPGNTKEINEYTPLESAINDVIAEEPRSKVDTAGVYFRDLNFGRWTGVNEDEVFAPGSLMKVVLMVAYLKEAQNDASVLRRTYAYSSAVADQLNGIPFETPSNLQVGKTYTVEQLIEAMIISSDNGAKNVLLDNVAPNSLHEIYTDLGLPYLDPSKNYDTYAISTKEYSVLLRILYNATYLSRDYSEKALGIMSQAEYREGLVAGVPGGTAVAQKFGESVGASNPAAIEITLSNCGIVYHPTHPYILCVMTKGQDIAALTQTIASISRAVWTSVGNYSLNQNY